MTAVGFGVGDRVRARIATPLVQAGTVGTIRLVYSSLDDTYEVQFDGYSYSWLMQGRDLEREAEAPLDAAAH